MGAKQLACTVGRYATRHYYELPANILEGITLVLLVFVQDIAFKQSVIVCAGLLFTSLILHGLAYKKGQCKVWPKVVELAAPVPFVAMIPAAYLATAPTQKTAFITINMWFACVQVVMLLAGRNFMMDYLQDWYPKEVWGTPLLHRCAAATAAVWIACELLMALAQGLAFAFNLSIDNGSNVGAAVFVCYIMQLLPLLFAIAFTFAYPARLKKRWGYVNGVRSTCNPPPANGATAGGNDPSQAVLRRAVDMIGGESRACLLCNSSRSSSGGSSSGSGAGNLCKSCSNSQQSMRSSGSSGLGDIVVCVSPHDCSNEDGKRGSTGGGGADSSRPSECATAEEVPSQQQEQQQQPQQQWQQRH